jgi:hypothetical protein
MKKIHLCRDESNIRGGVNDECVPFKEHSAQCFLIRDDAGPVEANNGVGKLAYVQHGSMINKRTYIGVQAEAWSHTDGEVSQKPHEK